MSPYQTSERIDNDDLDEIDNSQRLGVGGAHSEDDDDEMRGEEDDFVDDQHLSTHPSVLYD